VLVYPKVDENIDVTFEAGGYEARIVEIDLHLAIPLEIRRICAAASMVEMKG